MLCAGPSVDSPRSAKGTIKAPANAGMFYETPDGKIGALPEGANVVPRRMREAKFARQSITEMKLTPETKVRKIGRPTLGFKRMTSTERVRKHRGHKRQIASRSH